MRQMLFILYLGLLFPATVHAYTDPGSGTMLWQLGVSFCLGLLFYLKRFMSVLVKLIKKGD
ncbi:hypothetical protein [Geobacter pickeringii]|nr:hypothetical protein [Geobacter pickeringii]